NELKVGERSAWAREYVQPRGKVIEDEAIQYLIEISSSSITDIASKLDHAALFIGDENEITVQVLMKVAGVSSEYTIFNLETALLKQNPKEAHRIALSLISGGESVLRLLAFHRTTVFRMWQLSRAMRKPLAWQNSQEGQEAWQRIQQSMGRQAFKLNDYKAAARKIGEEQLRDAVVGLVELEVEAKSSTHETGRYFEWLWKLTTNRRNSIGTGVQTYELTG
ncbi:MAG: DNA polymerase III subunit delta, partial [Calditrichota bacterium]